MNKKIRFTSTLFTFLTKQIYIYKSKSIDIKSILVWLILITFLTSGLPIQGSSNLTNKKPEKSFEVIDFNAENEPKSESDSADIIDPTSTKDHNLIKVENGKKITEYAVLQIEYKTVPARRKKFTDSKKSRINGVTVLTTIGRFADVFVELKTSKNKDPLRQIYNDPNVLRAEWTNTISVPIPPPLVSAKFNYKGKPESIVRGGLTDSNGKKITGKNVFIAFVGTGIDYTHPDFITYDADGTPTSRIAYLWDTTLDFQDGRGVTAPFLYPNKVSIGTLFSQDQLTEELRGIKKGVRLSIPMTDEDGHETACASIAAGNGNGDYCEGGLSRSDVVGVAPDALIIGVRIGKDKLTNAYLLNAICEWLDQIAGENSLVISASFGGNYTGHDGQSVNERELNNRFENGDKEKRIMVVSAGNEARESIHAYASFDNKNNAKEVSWKKKKTLTKKSESEKPTVKQSTVMRLYFNNSRRKDIKIIPLENTIVKKEKWDLNKITNQIQARLEVESGGGRIRLVNTAGKQTEAHLYLESGNSEIFDEGVASNYLITTPGTAESVITVGSYSWNDNFHRNGSLIELKSSCLDKDGNYILLEIGQISCYSSPGPTRDNRYKPDVAAPGEWYTSSYAKGSTGWEEGYLDTTKRYVPMNGTSAATPYVAGVIALLFEKEPNLTTNYVKKLFKDNLTKTDLKPYPSKFPNNYWGNGKLDLEAIKRIVEALDKPKVSSD